MQIKFLGNTTDSYAGFYGSRFITFKRGEQADLADEIAQALLNNHETDFEVVVEQKPKHAPRLNKALKKTAQFKSK